MMVTPEQLVDRALALGFTMDCIGDLMMYDLVMLIRLDLELDRVADENGLAFPSE